MAVVPINSRLHPREVAFVIEDSGAALGLCCAHWRQALGEEMLSAGPRGHPFLLDFEELDRLSADADPGSLEDLHGTALAWLFYTSGTTGTPKGVMLSHENLCQMVLNFFADVQRPSNDDCLVHFGPLSHGSGMYVIPYVAVGAANVVPVDVIFASADCLSLLNSHQGSSMFLAPTMVNRLVRRNDIHRLEAQSMGTIIYGGGPMSVVEIQAAVGVLGPRFAQIYGQGECPMTITRLTRTEIEQAVALGDTQTLGSVGRPFTGVEVRLLQGDGRIAAVGEVGEVAVRGPTVMQGYWELPEATAEQIHDGWLRTGDLGSFGPTGRLSLKGRCKDLIISGGMNIYPREVEEALTEHPAVEDTAVIGVPDSEWGERVLAYVVIKREAVARAEDLDSHCLQRLAKFKRPRNYRFVEELPRNNYGKVLKRELRRLASVEGSAREDAYHE